MSNLPSQGDLLQGTATDPVQTDLAQLRQQTHHLRFWLFALCAALIPLSLAVDLFFAKQLLVARNQLHELRPQVERAKEDFERRKETDLRKYFEQLHVFASTNRDLQPLLDRYRPHLGRYYPLITPSPRVPWNEPPPGPKP